MVRYPIHNHFCSKLPLLSHITLLSTMRPSTHLCVALPSYLLRLKQQAQQAKQTLMVMILLMKLSCNSEPMYFSRTMMSEAQQTRPSSTWQSSSKSCLRQSKRIPMKLMLKRTSWLLSEKLSPPHLPLDFSWLAWSQKVKALQKKRSSDNTASKWKKNALVAWWLSFIILNMAQWISSSGSPLQRRNSSKCLCDYQLLMHAFS